ncbi:hypothetical protein H4R18_002730 [Coemansia javaensis]|uniref:Arrestin-like N-terminal domain-containing protein n=1 Tax=Coemansia javaensis TaxID=2761396 RepID=A0A9W8HDW4_9FUNG|nr:hypothetical protein H4R18_002730 [Coemansia javaensis]
MLSGPSVTLFPDSPDILLHGGPGDAGDGVITGRVVVAGRQAAQVARVTVTLRTRRGRMFHAQYLAAPATQLEAAAAAARVLAGGAREWQFSLSVPGALAETVYSRTCFVAYELVASAQGGGGGALGGFAGFSVQSRACDVAVKRVPKAGSMWMAISSSPVCETAVWRGRLELTVMAESRIVHDGQQVAVRGVVRPLEKGLVVASAGFQLAEHISLGGTATDPAAESPSKRVVAEGRAAMRAAVAAGRPSGAVALAAEATAERVLEVPAAYTGIQYDVHRAPIRTSHELALVLTVADALGCVHNLRLATPVFVLPRAGFQRTGLPRYEAAAADRLIASGAGPARRDSDFWSQFVLVDTDAAALPDPPVSPAAARPPAPAGYSAAAADADAPPPPPYPGAARAIIERTVVPASGTDPAIISAAGRATSRRQYRWRPPPVAC